MADLQAGDVPIVDITSLLGRLDRGSQRLRSDASDLRSTARKMRAAADQLDRVAATLDGRRTMQAELGSLLAGAERVPSSHEREDPPRP